MQRVAPPSPPNENYKLWTTKVCPSEKQMPLTHLRCLVGEQWNATEQYTMWFLFLSPSQVFTVSYVAFAIGIKYSFSFKK